jgi:hypothetical protein
LTDFARRDLYRAAVFFLMTPFWTDLSMSRKVWGSSPFASSAFLAATCSLQLPELGLQFMTIRCIDRLALFALAVALQGGRMISHRISLRGSNETTNNNSR